MSYLNEFSLFFIIVAGITTDDATVLYADIQEETHHEKILTTYYHSDLQYVFVNWRKC